MERIDFENIESKLDGVLQSPDYQKLVDKIKANKKIYFIGNGGLGYVGAHGAADMSRLIPGKAFYSFDSAGFITSNANDFGFDSLFVRWLETIVQDIEKPEDVLIIGMSCSGNSKNVVDALAWGHDLGYSTHMVSGVKSKKLLPHLEELVLDCKYFHTVEVLSLMMFYDLIIKCGSHCPTIAKENERKGN